MRSTTEYDPILVNPLVARCIFAPKSRHHPHPILHLTQQRMQNLLRILARLLHQPRHGPEFRDRCIAHQLIQEALARRDHRARRPEPRQRNRDLLRVARTDPIRQDVDLVPVRQQIQRRLRDADMALDAHEHDLSRRRRREVLRDRGDPHAEGRLVGVFNSVGDLELCACGPESCAVLRRGVDGDVKDGGRLDHLLSREDSASSVNDALCLRTRRLVTHIFSYSQTAGRNFSWMSHILAPNQLSALHSGRSRRWTDKRAGLSGNC